ncbi:MAG: head-tail adaptor protein [Sphingomonas fennica]
MRSASRRPTSSRTTAAAGRRPPGEEPWLDGALVYAEVIALRGGEAMRQSVERSIQLWRVEARPNDALVTRNRLIWNGLALDIKSAAPNELGDGIVMTCESGTGR